MLIVRALEVREALGTGDLAVLEAQPGDTVAADGGVGAAVGGRDERETADGRGSAGRGHADNGAPRAGDSACTDG